MTETISPSDKLACAEREIGYRRRVYGNLVKSGRMPQRIADREIAVMEAIAEDYRAQCAIAQQIVCSEAERIPLLAVREGAIMRAIADDYNINVPGRAEIPDRDQ